MFMSPLSGLDPASQRRAIRSMDAMTRARLYARHPAIQQDAVLHSELQRRNLLPVGSYHPGMVQGLTPRGYLSTEEARANLRESKGEPRYPDLVVQEVVSAPVSAPVSANLSTLAGSSPLANLSLDPFAFTPDTGVEVPTVFANEGGAVMPGLGFRPLRYSTGTGPKGVEDDYIGNVISQFNNLFTNNQMTDVVNLVNANPEVFFARGLDPRVAGIVQNLVAQELVNPPPTANQITTQTERVIAPPAPVGAGMDMPYPQFQAGGHVGRGTMAGELGRRGDLSVRQAGETMQERWKRMHGYANGGYASRGTVAGELPRYGHMSVREEGESMGELAKRHRDQDWYNRMGGGLGSFRRRMA